MTQIEKLRSRHDKVIELLNSDMPQWQIAKYFTVNHRYVKEYAEMIGYDWKGRVSRMNSRRSKVGSETKALKRARRESERFDSVDDSMSGSMFSLLCLRKPWGEMANV